MRVKRPMIGDVIEIDTGQGLAYAHYSHKNSKFGPLLRVFNRRFSERPVHLATAVAETPSFLVFFPLGAAIHRSTFAIAGHVPLSPEAQLFPLFRQGTPNQVTGKIEIWWIYDGEQSRRVGPLTDEIRSLSQLAACNDTRLIEMILEGYTPETDSRLG